MVTTPIARRLDTSFAWRSGEPLQAELKRLMAVLEARFAGLEAVTGTFESEVGKFEELGLSRLNDVLTPLASEAIDRLQDITALFSATSTTSVTIGLGAKQFLIPVEQRNTFVPTPYLSIFSGDQGMIAQRVALDREVGILSVDVVGLAGSGTFADWNISVSPSPSFTGYTQTEVDDIVAGAVGGLNTTLTTSIALKAPLASPSLTGNPLAPTQTTATNNTRIATTAFARAAANEIAAALVAAIQFPAAAVDAATVAHVRGATVGSPPHAITSNLIETASASVALTPAANVGIDWKSGINFTLAINQNSTLSNPSNGIPGTWRTVLVVQDANGTRTLNYGTYYCFPGGPAVGKPVIATGSGAESRISIFCRTTTYFEVYTMGLGLND